ncbi:MAG TPA: hypothetical protein VNX28_15295 [Gemmataceae bacterium]|nr:hypothetical protein [Gemmataceae bacterium]
MPRNPVRSLVRVNQPIVVSDWQARLLAGQLESQGLEQLKDCAEQLPVRNACLHGYYFGESTFPGLIFARYLILHRKRRSKCPGAPLPACSEHDHDAGLERLSRVPPGHQRDQMSQGTGAPN